MKKFVLPIGLLLLANASAQTLYGTGATFPEPLYSKMFSEYKKATGVSITYDGVGSGNGQKDILKRVSDFGGSDTVMAPDVLKAAPGKILHIPTAMGAVAVVYTLPGFQGTLKLDGSTLANMFLGKITKWNDPAIVKLNPGAKLPPLPINVVYRADASGTTATFTDYLSKVSPEFKSRVGESGQPKWPVGEAGRGNDGLMDKIKVTPGALSYVELAVAKKNRLSFASLKNKAGQFIIPDNGPTAKAAEDVDIADNFDTSLTNSAAPGAYPIVSFTYLMTYQDQKYGNRTLTQAQALKKLLGWMVTAGQQYNEPLDYAKLPGSVVKRVQKVLDTMTYGANRL